MPIRQKPETHGDYLSFQTQDTRENVFLNERGSVSCLLEIKTEAARHCTVALFSEPLPETRSIFFSVFSLPLSLHLSLHLLCSLPPCFLAHCSLSSCLWCTYVVTFHWLPSSLFLHSHGAFARQSAASPASFSFSSPVWRGSFLCLFTLTKD